MSFSTLVKLSLSSGDVFTGCSRGNGSSAWPVSSNCLRKHSHHFFHLLSDIPTKKICLVPFIKLHKNIELNDRKADTGFAPLNLRLESGVFKKDGRASFFKAP